MISDAVLSSMLSRIEANDLQSAEHPIFAQLRNRMKPQMSVNEEGIAILPIQGLLARKPDVFELFDGVEDSLALTEMISQASANPAVKAALFDIDSPGGFLQGGIELAEAVKNFGKPTVSFVGGDGASLAFWVASQADMVISTISASVGSIGAYTSHIDQTQRLASLGIKIEVIKNREADLKAAGLYGTAISDVQREHIQERVQEGFAQFRAAVKSSRPQIKDSAMRGQTFSGKAAKDAGLVDAIGSMGFALSLLRRRMR